MKQSAPRSLALLLVTLTLSSMAWTSAPKAQGQTDASAGWDPHTLQHDGRILTIDISKSFDPAMTGTLLKWIDFTSTALLQAYGRWPRKKWQVSMAPASAADSDPIPWAQVHRGEVDRVEFFISPRANVKELKHAWTGYHELAHLLIPYRGWGDSWFSEGLATYYQNIIAARAGILSEQQMWQKLYEGFERGRAEIRFEGKPLTRVNEELRHQGGFMRVYWSGAWYFLAADVRLRRQSGGRKSLDGALEKLNACCADQQLSAQEIVSELDKLNQVLLFQGLYGKVSASTTLPDYQGLFASLGISINGNKVQLQHEGPGALLRQRIVQPRNL